MWMEILVKTTTEGQFLKITRNEDQTTTTTIAYSEDIPESVRSAKEGSGEKNLNRHLRHDAEIVARSYNVELTDPVEFFVTKRGSDKSFDEDLTDFGEDEF